MEPPSPNEANKWRRNLYFVLACIGAAVGLGNLWRFPYMAYENGGSAFLIPYLVCVFVIGLPVMLLELGLGRWGNGSVAAGFAKVGKNWTWLGWWVLINSLVIVFYYAVVLAWCAQYVVYSFGTVWGNDPAAFFQKEVLGISAGPYEFGGVRWWTVAALLVVWASVFGIIRSGTKGLSKALVLTVPIPLILLLILGARSLTLPGAGDGLSFLFTPKLDQIFTFKAWAAAASQVILSLSLGMGQMVVYSSMKKDDSAVARSGLMICIGDTLFSILASVTVFASLGALAFSMNMPLDKLKLEGIFLAFVSYPMAVSAMPVASLWGVLFFTMLFVLGIDSVFAVIEANMAGVKEMKTSVNRSKLTFWFCVAGFLGGIPFATGAGLYWLDIIDHWVGYYSIAAIISLGCIILGHVAPLVQIRQRVGGFLAGALTGKLWNLLVKVGVPLALCAFFGSKLLEDLHKPYSGYPQSALLIGGWGVFVLVGVLGVVVGWVYNRRR
jgi:NSS family neurotransmitter:Na+ symporter